MTTSIQLGNIFTDQSGTTRVSGGASGFDIESLVNGLSDARRLPAVVLEERIEENAIRSEAFAELNALASTFRDAANFLRNPPGVNNADENIFEFRSADITASLGSNADSFLNISAEPGTPIGQFDITVDQVAQRNVKTTETFTITNTDPDLSDEDSSIVGGGGPFNAGTLTLGPNNVDIELEDGDSLNQVLAKINAVSDDSMVEASFIRVAEGEYRISFTTTETGADLNYDILPPFTADVNGIIAFEAENFASSAASTAPGTFGREFETITLAGASGGTAVHTQDLGQITNPDSDTELSAELTYRVELETAGTYYLWTNLQAPNNGSDTIHTGLNGVALTSLNSNNHNRPTDAGANNILAWSNDDILSPEVIQFTIAPGDEGVHDFNVYLREDGAIVDKFIITQDASFIPTGLGPSETLANNNNNIFNIGFAIEEDGQDAQLTIDGTQITRNTNDFDDVVDGLTFNVSNETPVGEELRVNIEPDTELTKQGILNFVESYNAIRIYTAQQNELGDDGQPTESSILAGDSTLRLITARINAELANQVEGLGDFSRLSDLGITFNDFPGDADTPFTRNILTLNEEQLDSALSTNYDGVRDIFEFNLTSDNANLQVFERTNGLSVSEFSVNVDSVNDIYTATFDDNGTPKTVNFDVEVLSGGGLVLNGQDGTELEGLVLLFSDPTDTTINVRTTQGVADRIFNSLDELLAEDTGAISVAIQSIADDEDRFTEDIARIDARVERFRESLIAQFSALEAAISSANTLLQSLDAQANARNS